MVQYLFLIFITLACPRKTKLSRGEEQAICRGRAKSELSRRDLSLSRWHAKLKFDFLGTILSAKLVRYYQFKKKLWRSSNFEKKNKEKWISITKAKGALLLHIGHIQSLAVGKRIAVEVARRQLGIVSETQQRGVDLIVLS